MFVWMLNLKTGVDSVYFKLAIERNERRMEQSDVTNQKFLRSNFLLLMRVHGPVVSLESCFNFSCFRVLIKYVLVLASVDHFKDSHKGVFLSLLPQDSAVQ